MELDSREVTLKAGDISIFARALVRKGPGKMPGIVLCHGLGSDHRSMLPVGRRLARLGHAVLLLDMRGHGRSGGSFRGDSWKEITQGLAFLHGQANVDPDRLAMVGFSMGAAEVVKAAGMAAGLSAVVLLSCPPDANLQPREWDRTLYRGLSDEGEKDYPSCCPFPWEKGPSARFRRWWMKLRRQHLRVDWRQWEEVGYQGVLSDRLKAEHRWPVLFVHCVKDGWARYEQVEKLFAACAAPKEMILDSGGFHSRPLLPGRIRAQWIGWLQRKLVASGTEEVSYR
ncbi:MAG: alpha/beta hydrolase [Chloroflexi bacterium]|nr:alpha/beta hydrolase [Chloroflexota bacterium]